MTQKIAIAVVHGIGKTNPSFKDENDPKKFVGGIAPRLKKAFAKELETISPQADADLIFEPVYWADVLQDFQDELYDRLNIRDRVSQFFGLRDFIFHSLADSVAYQPTFPQPSSEDGGVGDPNIYRNVHEVFAWTLNRLSRRTGTDAPLCIIGHSMGAAIATNYIWDAQKNRFPPNSGDTPLENVATLSALYTFGSQIPFWAMRFSNFGTPPQIPSPTVTTYYPNLTGEWLNFYDRHDLLGYPIRDINDTYRQLVTEQEVSVGGLLKGWNTLSHNEYWTSTDVTHAIARSLARIWKQIN
ncbi:MAG: hypothetical protein AAFQ57_14415 [Cyanobacteria bacterium J06626_14]